jgi:hypothetical protein
MHGRQRSMSGDAPGYGVPQGALLQHRQSYHGTPSVTGQGGPAGGYPATGPTAQQQQQQQQPYHDPSAQPSGQGQASGGYIDVGSVAQTLPSYQDPSSAANPAGHVAAGYSGIGSLAQQAASTAASPSWNQPNQPYHQQHGSTSSIPGTIGSPNSQQQQQQQQPLQQTYQGPSDFSSTPISMIPGRGSRQNSPNIQQGFNPQGRPLSLTIGHPPRPASDHEASNPLQSPAQATGDPNAQSGYGQYYGLSRQFAGVQLRDGGGSPPTGQQQAQQAPQGVGAPA